VMPSDLEQVIDIIYSEKGCNALLTASQVELIQQDIVREEVKPKERVELPELRPTGNKPSPVRRNREATISNDKDRRLRIAKAKVKAKLKILNLLKL